MFLGILLFLTSALHAMDHSPWQSVLDVYRTSSAKVDYAGIQASDALGAYMDALATATEPSGRDEKLAFWLNAYNAVTIDLVADSWPIASLKELDGGSVWTTRVFTVAGQQLTLDQMEKTKLVPLGDPRVHFVLNCASLGCPPLQAKAFSAGAVDSQLTDATQSWLRGKGVVVDKRTNKVMMSRIFDWYAHDFPDPGGRAIPGLEERLQSGMKFAAKNVPEDTAQFLLRGDYSVAFDPFSWAVNSK